MFRNVNKIIGKKNKLSKWVDKENNSFEKEEIVRSWEKHYFEKVSRNKDEKGLRQPQFGALSAIRAHWVVSNSPATVVLPTGTGKSETMFATIVSEQIASTLIIVPSNLLREQMYEGARTFGILPNLGMVSKEIIYPTVFLYKSKVHKEEENQLIQAIKQSNIIVSTPKMITSMSPDVLNTLCEEVEVVIYDEAHHLAAPIWSNVRSLFNNKKILQFTATPFRNDGKRIEGKLIFNYGLGHAQKAGYFKPIDFHPIQEYDETKSDIEIANKAVNQLKIDINEHGFDHVLLARANTKKRADELYSTIYSKYNEFNPVVIHSDIPAKKRSEALEKVRNGESRIVVCVDMFGEGIDIPTLKIAAIHDKYKSLPITLQFIGRFARASNKKIGNAKLITNVALDEIKDAIEELYHQDSDWNNLLKIHSTQAIEVEEKQYEFTERFKNGRRDKIDISQLKMKISTRMSRVFSQNILISKWREVLDPDRTTSLINETDSVFIFIEEVESKVGWSEQKNLIEYTYELFVIFFDKENSIIHINETNSKKGKQLIERMFIDSTPIKGDQIYRSLDDINLLLIGTLGLKQQPSGRISFRMFAGADVKNGINEAIVSGSTKSNLFGYGYRNGERISIGCSYNGKVWMRWVEKVSFWTEWCKSIGEKVLDDSIDTGMILENSLTMELIKGFPNGVPYKIVLPEEVETSNSLTKQLYLAKEDKYFPFFQTELRNPKMNKKTLQFDYFINERVFKFEQQIDDKSYNFKQIDGENLSVRTNNQTVSLADYFKQYSPEISFIQDDGNVILVQENLATTLKAKSNLKLSERMLHAIDWGRLGVDIKIESQGKNKKSNSIQYATIHKIVDQTSDVIFDDDGSGEIADVVSINIDQKNLKVKFHLYHCKYSDGATSGGRVKDLYEVCGQAEKSILWCDNKLNLVQRLIERENKRMKDSSVSRFEKGNLKTLQILKKMLKSNFETEFEVSIVQPGVSINKMTKPMNQIILATDGYLKDTFGISLTCYFSE